MNNMEYFNNGSGMAAYPKSFLNTHEYNTARGKWVKKQRNNNNNRMKQAPKPRMGFRNRLAAGRKRLAHAFRRHVGMTVNGKNVYMGIRGGLFTANGTPVHNRNGRWTTN